MKCVVVVGNSDGGKSVLARKLSAAHSLPYCEVDALMWRPGWQFAPEGEYVASHACWVAEPRWVMDGLGQRGFVLDRLARATDIVLVDLPLWMHIAFAAERQTAWATGRLEYPPACSTQTAPTAGLFRTIWEVDRDWMPVIRSLIRTEEAQGKRISRIVSVEELDAIKIDGWVK